jgi:hypothetical protein
MNIHLDVAILIFGDSNQNLNEKKQCADELYITYNPLLSHIPHFNLKTQIIILK